MKHSSRRHSHPPQKDRALWFQQKAAFPMRDASPVELEKYWASQVQADVSPEHRWQSLGPANIAGRVTALAIHPDNRRQWFAGSAAGGVWVSNDAGESWTPAWSRFATQNIGALGWLKNKKLIGGLFLIAATGEANGSGDSYPGSGIYQSADTGLTWQQTFDQAGAGFSIEQDIQTFPRRIGAMALRNYRLAFGSIFLDNSLPAGLYLADVDNDTGLHAVEFWGKRSYNCHSVVFHPHDQDILYASIEPDGSQNGIWRSSNFGKSWVHLTNGLPSCDQFRRISLAFAPSDPDVIYALAAGRRNYVLGVFRSSNGGKSWREILGGRYPKERQMQYNNVIAVHPRRPDQVVWGGMHLYRTDDAGRRWRRITNGDRSAKDHVHNDHHALLWPEDDLIISGNDGGVAVSENGGRNWRNCSRGMVTTMFYSLAMAPGNGNVFAGGTQDNGIIIGGVEGKAAGEAGVLTPAISGDGGWVVFDSADFNSAFASVAPFIIYHHAPGQPWNDWKSIKPHRLTDDEIAQRVFTVIAIDPSPRSGVKTLWAGSTRLWRTDDNGRSWKPVSQTFDGTPISAIAISSGRERVLIVGTSGGGIFRSRDEGRAWTQSLRAIDIPQRAITDIQFHPARPGTVVITVASSGVQSSGVDLRTGGQLPYRHVFRSENCGDEWTDIDGGALPNVVYYAAAFETKPPYRLFVAGDLGVWTLLKRGWTNISGNLPSVIVSGLKFHAKNGTLTAATYGRGIWRMKPGRLQSAAQEPKKRVRQVGIATGLRVNASLSAPVAIAPAGAAVITDPLRSTVVDVEPFPDAIGYQVELAAGSTSMAFGSRTTQIAFNGFRRGNGRWRVWAVLPDGLRSPASGWRKIHYTR
jgi:photosystem II stability/assembly factor-like uncharacterized protein